MSTSEGGNTKTEVSHKSPNDVSLLHAEPLTTLLSPTNATSSMRPAALHSSGTESSKEWATRYVTSAELPGCLPAGQQCSSARYSCRQTEVQAYRLIQRNITHNDEEMAFLEHVLGYPPDNCEAHNLDSRFNLICVPCTPHTAFDDGYWYLLPDLITLKSIKNWARAQKHAVRDEKPQQCFRESTIFTPPTEVTYTLIAKSAVLTESVQKGHGHDHLLRINGNTSDGPNSEQLFEYPFSNLPRLISDASPFHVLLNALPKLHGLGSVRRLKKRGQISDGAYDQLIEAHAIKYSLSAWREPWEKQRNEMERLLKLQAGDSEDESEAVTGKRRHHDDNSDCDDNGSRKVRRTNSRFSTRTARRNIEPDFTPMQHQMANISSLTFVEQMQKFYGHKVIMKSSHPGFADDDLLDEDDSVSPCSLDSLFEPPPEYYKWLEGVKPSKCRKRNSGYDAILAEYRAEKSPDLAVKPHGVWFPTPYLRWRLVDKWKWVKEDVEEIMRIARNPSM